MPTPYPENTQYADKPGVTPNDFANLVKSMPKSTVAAPAQKVDTSQYVQKPVSMYGSGSSTSTSTDDFYKNPGFVDQNPTGVPIGDQGTTPTVPTPAGYTFPKPEINPLTGQAREATPSPTTITHNWPGGGQFITDPTQPDKFIKSYGNDMGITAEEAARLRGGRSAADVKIDYIIPIADGGTTAYANKQLLTTSEYIQKQKVEGVSNTLYDKGLITKDQKFQMDVNWRDKDTSAVPMPDQFGYINNLNDSHLQSFNTTKNDPAALKAYYAALGVDSKAQDINKEWDFNLQNPIGSGASWLHNPGKNISAVAKEIPEAFKTVGSNISDSLDQLFPKPISEFEKGFIQGSPIGLFTNMPKISEEADHGGFWGTVSRDAGNLLGFTVGLGFFKTLLKPLGSLLSKIPGVAGAFSSPTIEAKTLGILGQDAGGIGTIGTEEGAALKTAPGRFSRMGSSISNKLSNLPGVEAVKGGLSKTKNILSRINNFGQVVSEGGNAATNASSALSNAGTLGAKDIAMQAVAKRGWALPSPMVQTALLFGSKAVVDQYIREGLGLEDQKSFSDHALNFATNAVTGGVFEKINAGQTFGGYAKLGSVAFAMSAMNGDKPEDMIANVVTMVGMHGMGSNLAQKLSLGGINPIGKAETPQSRTDALVNEMTTQANLYANNILNQYAPEGISTINSKNLHPEIGTKQQIFTSQQLAEKKNEAISNMYKLAEAKNWSQEDIITERNRIIGAVNQLDSGNQWKIVGDPVHAANIKSVFKYVNDRGTHTAIDGKQVSRNVYDLLGDKKASDFPPVSLNYQGFDSNEPNGQSKYSIAHTIWSVSGNEANQDYNKGTKQYETSFKTGQAPLGDYVWVTPAGDESAAVENALNVVKEKKGEPLIKNPGHGLNVLATTTIPVTGKTDFPTIGRISSQEYLKGKNDVAKAQTAAYETRNKKPLSGGTGDFIEYDENNYNEKLYQWLKENNLTGILMKRVPLKTGTISGKSDIKKSEDQIQRQSYRLALTDALIDYTFKLHGDQQKNPPRNDSGGVVHVNQPPETTPPSPESSPLASSITQVAKQQSSPEITQVLPGTLSKEEIKDLKRKNYTPEMIKQVNDLSVKAASQPQGEIPEEKNTSLEEPQKKTKIPDPSQFIQTSRGVEGVNQLAAFYISDKKAQKDFTRVKLTEMAKEVSNGGTKKEDVISGWPKFLENFTNKLHAASGDPSITFDQDKLKKLYTSSARSGIRNEVIVNKGTSIEPGSVNNTGKIDIATKEFNKKNGFPENSMEVVHVSPGSNFEDMTSSKNFNKLSDDMGKMKDGKYLPMGITGKGIENTTWVKFEPKMVERFDSDPGKYENPGEKLTTPEDKFTRAYIVDVLGMPKDIKDGDLVKRANLIYHRYDQYLGPDMNVKLITLPAKKIGDESSFKIGTDKFENPTSKEAKATVDSYPEGKMQDGQIYMGEKAFDEYIKGLGYNPTEHTGSVKALIDSTTPNGEKIYHKGQFTKVDDAIRTHYKEEYGIDIGPKDVISFDTNAKIGPKTGETTIPLSDIYAKSRSTSDSISRETPSHERKFLSTDEGVKSDTLIGTNKKIENLKGFIDEVKKSKNKEELSSVFDKYAEEYGLDKDVLFQGVKQKSFDLGAAKKNLSFEIAKITKNILGDSILAPTYKNSTMVTINAPIKADFDGNGKSRYPNDHEIVLGKEQIKTLHIKEGDSVVVHRDPSYDINNIAILKVIDGSRFGHTSLGKENGEISPYNERIILQGDQDADTMHVTKIGEGGISQSQVNAILKRGKLATPFTEVNPSSTNYATNQTIKDKINDQLVGDDQTSFISTQARIMDEVKDNKITVKVYPGSKFSGSKFEILSNGKVVETGNTTRSIQGFIATPKWGPEERQLISQAQREAVDSKKSKDIANRTQNDPQWALKQLWGGENGHLGEWEARALSGALKSIQAPYGIKKLTENAKSIDDIFQGSIKNPITEERDSNKGLNNTIKYYENLKKAGTELTPRQEKILTVSTIRDSGIPREETVQAHKNGSQLVEKTFGSKYNPQNPKLKEIIDLATKAKNENFKEGATKEEKATASRKVEDFFLSKLDNGDYSPSDLNNIAYWAATDKLANIKQFANAKNPTFVFTYRELINAAPDIAKKYHEGFEAEQPKDGKGGPGPKSFTNLTNIIKNLYDK